MKVYDDKSNDVVITDKYCVVTSITEDEVVFKASYIVTTDIICSGKITALFDLVVFGDIIANEIDVKGRLICIGNCKATGSIVVQNDIWANDLQAKSIVAHDQIVAQYIDASYITADGNVIVGKTLSIEAVAELSNMLICGETAFGAGRVVADMVMTAEPLDLDDGIDAIESPNSYTPTEQKLSEKKDYVEIGTKKYVEQNDYEGYIGYLIENIEDGLEQLKLNNWLKALYRIDSLSKSGFKGCNDGSLLIKLLEIYSSVFFSEWKVIEKWIQGINSRLEEILGVAKRKYVLCDCHTMEIGDVVIHKKYGKGRVMNVIMEANSRYVVVSFMADNKGQMRKFLLPGAISFFKTIKVIHGDNANVYERIVCSVNSYQEWLESLIILEKNRSYIKTDVYLALFDRLMAYVGLKSKYIADRFSEKGWK